MRIAPQRPYHLSNYEVLQHCLSLHEDMTKLAVQNYDAFRRNKDRLLDEYAIDRDTNPKFPLQRPNMEGLPEGTEEVLRAEDVAQRRGPQDECRWVNDQVIKYLGNWYMPTFRQNAEGVTNLIHELQEYDLSKGEILQLVNHAPDHGVAVHNIIENMEERFPGDEHEQTWNEILEIVERNTLPQVPPELGERVTIQGHIQVRGAPVDDGDPGHANMDGEGGQGATEGAGQWSHAHGHDDEMMEGDEDDFMNQGVFVQDEYVHEAEWGPGKEGGVDDDVPDND